MESVVSCLALRGESNEYSKVSAARNSYAAGKKKETDKKERKRDVEKD